MIRIGKIVAAHGLQGAVVMTHIVKKAGWLNENDVLFIELRKESYIPYFVQQAKASGSDEYIVQFEDVDALEEARKLIGKHVYGKEEVLAAHSDDSPLLWIGFNIVDKEKGSLGPLEDVMQAGAQWLGKITYQENEVLIPLVKPVILDINTRNKYIRVELPAGLLEIYTDK